MTRNVIQHYASIVTSWLLALNLTSEARLS